MVMNDKLGAYIQKLMVTVIDSEQDKFIQDLARQELNAIRDMIVEFLNENERSESEELPPSEKVLLKG
jgi:hypothetical protein|tara:strand:- start:5519 stop:5722 length:204 start_codon:yes stop_codon:yes gene_type:complete